MQDDQNLAAQLLELADLLEADADAAEDPAKAVMYRLRARQAVALSSYWLLRFNPADAAKLQEPVAWETPPDSEDTQHVVGFYWDKGGLMAVEVARADGERLRLSDLRDSTLFPFRKLVRDDREYLAEESRRLEVAASSPIAPEGLTALAKERRERVLASRSPRPPEHWKEVARIYSEAVANHHNAPVGRVAEEFTVSKSTARNWVANCRKFGYLPPTEERKAKGNPI